MLFTDLVIAVLAFLGATTVGWALYRVERWQRDRFRAAIDQALHLANGRQP